MKNATSASALQTNADSATSRQTAGPVFRGQIASPKHGPYVPWVRKTKLNTSRRSRVVAISVGVVAAITLSSVPVNAQTIDDPNATSSFTVTDGTAQPQLDPGTIGLCNAGFGDVSVASWNIGIGHVDLFCGDNSSGYVHIRTDHQLDWQSVVDNAGGGALWDDFMVFATGASLTAPAPGYPVNAGSGKLCYTTPVQIRDRDGNVVDTYNPTVIVSQNNLKVITSYPTHFSSGC